MNADGWFVNKALPLLRKIRENFRTGMRPQRLKEKQATAEATRVEEMRSAERAKLKSITFRERPEQKRPERGRGQHDEKYALFFQKKAHNGVDLELF